MMQLRNRFAFKEWAVVCEALDTGRQSLILRKGGIHEGREGFRVEHREFWLFPTEFHQQPGVLSPDARPLLDVVQLQEHSPETVAIRNYVVVEDVIEIRDEAMLPRLVGLHVWSESTLHQRFHYRNPMLFALVVRVYRRAEPMLIPNSTHFSGCRSWVDLPGEIATNGLHPVVSQSDHELHRDMIRTAMHSSPSR
jgi:hypothetical protein